MEIKKTTVRVSVPESPVEETFGSPPEGETWKKARSGVLLFCLVHFLFEVFAENKTFAAPLVINYWLSSWYIKREIAKRYIRNPFAMGLKVGAAVFGIRLLIGLAFVLSTRSDGDQKNPTKATKNIQNFSEPADAVAQCKLGVR
jgi:hypothetical protein